MMIDDHDDEAQAQELKSTINYSAQHTHTHTRRETSLGRQGERVGQRVDPLEILADKVGLELPQSGDLLELCFRHTERQNLDQLQLQ